MYRGSDVKLCSAMIPMLTPRTLLTLYLHYRRHRRRRHRFCEQDSELSTEPKPI
jgi:hypothetical protein